MKKSYTFIDPQGKRTVVDYDPHKTVFPWGCSRNKKLWKTPKDSPVKEQVK